MNRSSKIASTCFLLMTLALAALGQENSPVWVEVHQGAHSYQLFRDGQPYAIKGVVGDGNMPKLAATMVQQGATVQHGSSCRKPGNWVSPLR